jgi:UDP-N-acetylmuramoyl-tripeptide--D-alanyl-D-alanine ligase
MRGWDAARAARAAGALLLGRPSSTASEPGPQGVTIDSRTLAPGELFVGLRGERTDGGAHAVQAIDAGAWGVLVTPEGAHTVALTGTSAAVLSHPDPLQGLQALALAWRRELAASGTKLVAITGSTGKTSTKDILAALLAKHVRTAASAENLNTEIGLPLAVLAAPSDTEVLIVEMAMRGAGQIAELTAIAEPDVGVIVNVGPAHLERLGSLEAIAEAKAELIAGLAPGKCVVIPADSPLLAEHVRPDLRTIRFGEGGEIELAARRAGDEVVIREGVREIVLEPSFSQAHNLRNLLAAVAAARALGITPSGRVQVQFSSMRGEQLVVPGGVILINDCYNANPMSMRAAIDELAETPAARRVAVLGDMLELGPGGPRMHGEIAEHAAARGVELLVTVGPLAAEMRASFGGEAYSVADADGAATLLSSLLRDGDAVLVKGSRAVGLERVAQALGAGPPQASAGVIDNTPSVGGDRRAAAAKETASRNAPAAAPAAGSRRG